MPSINPNKLAEPIYVRLPVEMAEQIRRDALEQGRTLSLQLRWILRTALLAQEQSESPMNDQPIK
jgi:hypothetical protein